MSQFDFNRLDLLLKEIEDPYVQENFYRLKQWIEQNNVGGGGGGGSTSVSNTVIDADIWDQFSKPLAISTTNVADTVALVNFVQLDYFLTFKDSVSSKVKTLKLLVLKDDSSIKDQISQIAGSPLDLDIEAVINGSDMELQITNNELSVVNLQVTRLVTN